MEMQENGPWTVDEWSNDVLVLQIQDFHHDAALEISGDFGTPEIKKIYAEELCRRLNAMNPVVANAIIQGPRSGPAGMGGYRT